MFGEGGITLHHITKYSITVCVMYNFMICTEFKPFMCCTTQHNLTTGISLFLVDAFIVRYEIVN